MTEAVVPSNWQGFLRVDNNKTELFKFLSNALFKSFHQEGKQLVITVDAVMKRLCMLFHANHSAHLGHSKILTRTVDTDHVVALAVYVTQYIGLEYELWIAFGTSKHFQYLAVHKMASEIGLKKGGAESIPMIHALTGYETVSSYVGHGKKRAWATWNVMPELTDLVHHMSYMEVFCTPLKDLLYDRTSTCNDIDEA